MAGILYLLLGQLNAAGCKLIATRMQRFNKSGTGGPQQLSVMMRSMHMMSNAGRGEQGGDEQPHAKNAKGATQILRRVETRLLALQTGCSSVAVFKDRRPRWRRLSKWGGGGCPPPPDMRSSNRAQWSQHLSRVRGEKMQTTFS